jgi:hypothetical protein
MREIKKEVFLKQLIQVNGAFKKQEVMTKTEGLCFFDTTRTFCIMIPLNTARVSFPSHGPLGPFRRDDTTPGIKLTTLRDSLKHVLSRTTPALFFFIV